jgi:hypothetical protein
MAGLGQTIVGSDSYYSIADERPLQMQNPEKPELFFAVTFKIKITGMNPREVLYPPISSGFLPAGSRGRLTNF